MGGGDKTLITYAPPNFSIGKQRGAGSREEQVLGRGGVGLNVESDEEEKREIEDGKAIEGGKRGSGIPCTLSLSFLVGL